MTIVDEFLARVTGLVADEPARPGDRQGVAGILRRLCSAAERALSASGAGVSVLAGGGMRGVAAVSEPAYELLEELQFSLGEGPCLDAFAGRQPVLVPDLSDGAMVRWPGYAPALHGRGVRAVFAFPLQIGSARLGALDVFRARTGSLTDDEFREALTFADIAVTTLLDGQARAAPGAAADGLDDEVVGQRAELFQAQGMVAVQLGISLVDALARLRAYAYAEDRALGDVARDVVARRVAFDSGQS
ncbi:GAF and ANTAR domain-containing protein [Actinoplanes sp. TRM 88003]|uniref:GAF and ANTAR domain-containing protein n=1 Tax=Paractinoplanes aksuensis TaxID=2939490 RepID=A0ABT1DL93_9ACTN|nr:GAF and ANTAR domain-containing protein [Actinoplanes aksuensis]MCO8271575.1 GAF and ANTAR domain-containing protein [Actinoplanes aksuensis]